MKKVILLIFILEVSICLLCQMNWLSSFLNFDEKITVSAHVDAIERDESEKIYKTAFSYIVNGNVYKVDMITDKGDLSSSERLLRIAADYPEEAFRTGPIIPYKNRYARLSVIAPIVIALALLQIRLKHPSDFEQEIERRQDALNMTFTLNERDRKIGIAILIALGVYILVGIFISIRLYAST
ncbi:MAG: hypothetical protein IJ711_03905 [Lachnospiraceae bacterium]|nr:hypothetical protein [Lachnospiraceae bacterium]